MKPYRMQQSWHWITMERGRHSFLNPIFDSFGFPKLRLWVDDSVTPETFDRAGCGGLITAVGDWENQNIAIVWSDFRVNGASYGRENSARYIAFLQRLQERAAATPLIFIVNSAGVSLMEGRQVFSDAFGLWPRLLAYADRNPVFTCAVGKCLGLAPLLFGLGHYRVAVAGQTQVNLTGPEVIAQFFGTAVDFKQSAAAERFYDNTDLIHELVPSTQAACDCFKELLTGSPQHLHVTSPGDPTAALLESFLDATPQEVIPGWCARLRVFLGHRNGHAVGVFANPLERSNNMVTVRTLDKYAAGLDLFRALRVPIVSLLDSPGVDPRFEQSDANNLRRMLAVGERIIHYPHGSMGIITRRCFGGSATLSFPKVFGGKRVVALRGSTIGTMHESIIEKQLKGSPRLLSQWRETAATQTAEMDDLLAHGSLDAVIDACDAGREIDFLIHGAAHITLRQAI